MKMQLVLLAMLFSACGNSPQSETIWTCDCRQQAAAAQWIGDHMADANNRSDEEMEDVIYQLQKTAVQMHCRQRQMQVTRTPAGIVNAPVDSCLIIYDYR